MKKKKKKAKHYGNRPEMQLNRKPGYWTYLFQNISAEKWQFTWRCILTIQNYIWAWKLKDQTDESEQNFRDCEITSLSFPMEGTCELLKCVMISVFSFLNIFPLCWMLLIHCNNHVYSGCRFNIINAELLANLVIWHI